AITAGCFERQPQVEMPFRPVRVQRQGLAQFRFGFGPAATLIHLQRPVCVFLGIEPVAHDRYSRGAASLNRRATFCAHSPSSISVADTMEHKPLFWCTQKDSWDFNPA